MFKKTQVCSAALTLLGGALMLAAALPAAAQTAERIEITGSRIKSLNADSPSPLQSVTVEEIQSSGAVNIQELLLKNPTLGTPTLSRTNSNFFTTGAGVATVDLRNLGTARTLVLVNGRRFVSGVPGDSAVDLNSIPTEFIERVDLLTGGASSTYGSDAVAGVVNIIYKRNFEGVEANIRTGQSDKRDDKTSTASLTWGVNSANGKGNIMTHLGYTNQGAVYSNKRDRSAVDQISTGYAVTGDPADAFAVTRPFLSSFAPQGRIFISPGVTGASRTFDASGNVIPFSTNGPDGDGIGATGYNRSEARTIAVPVERYLFATKGNYNLNDDLSVFMEGTYALTKARTRLEPLPLNSTDIYKPDGNVAAEFLVNGALVRNPLVPDSIYNLLGAARNADGARQYSFTRRLSDIADRSSRAERNTFRLVTGVQGSFLSRFDYDLYIGYGSTGESQVGNGQVNVANFRNALEAIPGAGGTAVCRDPIARTQGCVPISIFGYNSISPDAARYVAAPSSLSTSVTQRLVGGNISGEILKLPAGPLGMAVGFEYRKETSRSEFDALTQAGLNAGNAAPSTIGEFNVKELYAEFKIPLLKDLPAIKSLALTAAARASDYSTVGSTTSWNTGLEWAPVNDVKVRLTGAQSTRAPNISELFDPPQQTFPTGLADPCVGVTATSTSEVSAGCRAAPGVAANIAANGSFTLNQSDLQGISGYNRGNPTLKQEVGKSITAGLVLTPSQLRGMTFTADYFDIKIDDAIVGTPRQFILQQCYAGNAALCQFITRRATQVGSNSAGSISFIDSAQTNSGEKATSGIDLTASYAGKVGPGNFTGKIAYTRLISGYDIPLPGSDKDYFAGEVGAAKNRAVMNLGYKYQGFGVALQTTYIGRSSLDDQFLATAFNDPLPRDAISVGAKVYNDLQLTYDWKKTQFYFGVDNVLNTKPPALISGLPGNTTGAETDAGTYDAIGRRYYVGVRTSF